MVKKITARGFGARYGKSVRQKYAKVENKQRKRQECPFCKKTAKRLSPGIWKCKSCGKKFASGTYCIDK
jgi:large subunit ribosomal protein L37Ae